MLYHLMLSGNCFSGVGGVGLNVGPGFLFFGGGGGGVLSPRDFLRSPFLPHSIIPITCNPEYPPRSPGVQHAFFFPTVL